ncbi:MAG: DUF2851 family protein [Rikenellaceae bacterium]|nr:DUF2851 family protein [Rikenellaceae bacterium]
MENPVDADLLALVWRERMFAADALETVDGRPVTIVGRGECAGSPDVFTGCEVVIDGTSCRGDVLLSCGELPALRYGRSGCADSAVLQVVPERTGFVCRSDGSFVPQLVVECPVEAACTYERLRRESRSFRCSYHIGSLDGFRRETLFTRLSLERLERKYGDVMAIHAAVDRNWNETFYILLLRSMGANTHKEMFTRLAYAVPYVYVTRERTSLRSVEAMLLGGAGLLEGPADDEYTRMLREEFDYLRRKYDIRPLRHMGWREGHANPGGLPVLRIAQLAAFLSTQEFVFSNIVACRTPDDVHRLFRAEASAYWTDHFVMGQPAGRPTPKRMGEMIVDILGINLVVPLLFAYGSETGEEALREAAVDLLGQIAPERNRIIKGWAHEGVSPATAFESQALIQLYRTYCEPRRCAACPVGRPVLRQSVGL